MSYHSFGGPFLPASSYEDEQREKQRKAEEEERKEAHMSLCDQEMRAERKLKAEIREDKITRTHWESSINQSRLRLIRLKEERQEIIARLRYEQSKFEAYQMSQRYQMMRSGRPCMQRELKKPPLLQSLEEALRRIDNKIYWVSENLDDDIAFYNSAMRGE